mmetsp:Transcript_32835/g.82448  ORF Transcript_32835/g.82448 Transcript_32835/m.82448 type:complete len:221 (+) Transcript_32835:337-999(+)|eukprot:CAMPEP_0177640252 /NCGR_PEP_ID=MMETSP0447-20121125/6445_1 /TAXON_ID=0 /ORGANISM="Stygamoeba regulata, Strain BSH-02190019" /LENGTH=220 /DNA_ID=CAMNT_0019142313 /DNA_START=221 /DNA_END=883 /DNA_ORIENTATION=+
MSADSQPLQSANFKVLIGGPLQAIIEAQELSARNTFSFVKEVGFKPKSSMAMSPSTSGGGIPGGFSHNSSMNLGDPIFVDFTYSRFLNGEDKACKMSIPFLVLVPIPNLRIHKLQISFNVRVHSSTKASGSSKSSGGSLDFWAGRASFTGQSSSYEGESTKTYSLSVKVRGIQAPMPGGMEKVMQVLDTLIKEQQSLADQAAATEAAADKMAADAAGGKV